MLKIIYQYIKEKLKQLAKKVKMNKNSSVKSYYDKLSSTNELEKKLKIDIFDDNYQGQLFIDGIDYGNTHIAKDISDFYLQLGVNDKPLNIDEIQILYKEI